MRFIKKKHKTTNEGEEEEEEEELGIPLVTSTFFRNRNKISFFLLPKFQYQNNKICNQPTLPLL